MKHTNYWLRRPIARRAALRGAGIGAAGLVGAALIGCSSDEESAPAPAAATTAATAAATATADAAGAMQPKSGGVSVAVSANVYETVDPHRTVASPVLTVLSRAQSKLLRFSNPNVGTLTGDLAETWEQVDPTTVVLNMRKGVKWHSAGPGAKHPAASPGRDLTVEDVVWNIDRQKAGLLADGSSGAFGRKSYWNKIASIDTPDASTLRFTLAKPDGTFLEGLANEFNLIVQPELMEAVEAKGNEISADKVIGTGPYILTEWVPGKRISAVRNPDYYITDRPYLDGAVWGQAFEDPTAYRIGFEQKQVDSMTDPDPAVTQAVHQQHQDEAYLSYGATANTVAIYLDPSKPPFNDIRLIQAVHLAFDRRQLIQQLHNGLGRVSGPVSWLQEAWAIPQEEFDNLPGYRTAKAKDLEEANALWAAAGGADAGEITWVVPETWAQRAAWSSTPEIIAEMFNKAFGSSQFKAKTASYGEIIPSWSNKNFDPFFGWIPNVEIPDARADMLAAFSSTSPANIWGVNQPAEIDAKLAKAAELLDKNEANEILRDVQDFILENGQFGRVIAYNYIFPVVRWNYTHVTQPREGEEWNFLSNSLDAVDAWFDPDDPSAKGRAKTAPTPI